LLAGAWLVVACGSPAAAPAPAPAPPAAAAPAPPATHSSAKPAGGRLAPIIIQTVVRNQFRWFRLCYEEGLKRDPKLEGKVGTRFVIDPDGRVRDVIVEGTTLHDREVIACIVRGFKALTFPPPDGGKVTVVYPIMFSPWTEPPPASSADAAPPAPPESSAPTVP
jgi:hypothetical protein